MADESVAVPIQGIQLEPASRKTLVDRLMSVFADVRTGEGKGAVLLGANVFLLLESYYILKTVREALILSEGGAAVKTYSSAIQAALLLLIIPAYGALASRVNRERLILFMTLFFASHLVLFYVAGRAGFHVGVPFFLWVGVFNVFVISQFWAFANDFYNKEQGSRLLPIVGIGSSLGAWLGSVYAGKLFPVFGTYGLMLVAGGFLLLCVVVNRMVGRLQSGFCADAREAGAEPLGRDGALKLILGSRYLLWIAMLMMVVNVVNTTGEFILGKLVVENADSLVAAGSIAASEKAAVIGMFYGSFFSWVNLAGIVLQVFFVSRIFKYVGIRGALFVLPLISMISYGMVALAPVLALVRIAKVMENSTDYSVQNTARQALFLPTSREAKYKAKAAIDSFFWRAGDLLAAAVVFIGIQLGFGTQHYAWVNLGFAVVWLVIVGMIAREHKKLSPLT